GWRSVYPPEVFAEQMERIAIGFVGESLTASLAMRELCGGEEGAERLREEVMFAEVAGIHFQSVANQARFVTARTALAEARTASEAAALCEGLERILEDELGWARRLYGIRDSRIGFEASNQYYYVPLDLAEKVLNCRDLLDRWLPAERVKWGL
ncbi:MAG TPA: hypothetical protein VK689_23325, partial [Armatimonadota bacterium]|nr:hypothetical protein [Armatimonadota bacterium]